EPGRRGGGDGAEALACPEARHVADELGHVAQVPDVPVRLAGRIAEIHLHHVEHGARLLLSWSWRPHYAGRSRAHRAAGAGLPNDARDDGSPAGGAAASGLAAALGPDLGEHLGGHQHGLADDRHADVAGEVQQRFRQLLLGPALLEGEAQVDVELGVAPGRRVGDDADERARLDVEAWARPQRAEHRLGGDVDELLHDGVARVVGLVAREVGFSPQTPADRLALPVELAVGHWLVSSPIDRARLTAVRRVVTGPGRTMGSPRPSSPATVERE